MSRIKKIYLFNAIKKSYYLSVNLKKKLYNHLFPTARILLYHRIADVKNDPYFLSVSSKNFYNQLKFLKENFDIVPLAQIVKWVRERKLKDKSIALTFDDGYADNLYNALPILEKFKVPATIFLTAGYINTSTEAGQNKPFYWDQNIPPEDRGRPMTQDEAKRLSNSRLIEIGSHTISHPKLATLSENEQFEEIERGKKILEEMLNIPILSFAYPFGDKKSFTTNTISLIKKVGYQYACANIHERVTAKSNIYTLPRFIVRNWNIEELKKEIKKWI